MRYPEGLTIVIALKMSTFIGLTIGIVSVFCSCT